MVMKQVDAETVKNWIANDEVVLIDVREEDEYEKENIPQAILIPLARISLRTLPDSTGKKLVIHCHSGRRSAVACEKLIHQGWDEEIYNLEGGILGWKR